MNHAENRSAFRARIQTSRRAIDQTHRANKVEQGRARLTLLKGIGSWRVEPKRNRVLIFTSSETPRARTDLALTLSHIECCYRLLPGSSRPRCSKLVCARRGSIA